MSNDAKHPKPWDPRPERDRPERAEPTPAPQDAGEVSLGWLGDVVAALVVIGGTIYIVTNMDFPGFGSHGRELGAVEAVLEFMAEYILALLVVMLVQPLYALAYFACMLWLIIRFDGWRRSRRAPRQE